ncbi:MAG: PQQ-binding-like beta-propeller repeat protein, partial [Lentisphaerae bacterium]|nr:PQQ-binding-like beta-propeller repeat protein [Lentisphaerota bacterium]
PTSPHYEPVLNIVEQTCNRRLEAGEAACFQNLFHAGRGEDRHAVELRRLDDHCALIRTGDQIELFGASVSGLSRRFGDLEFAGRLVLIGADRRLLHDATASLAGRALAAGTDHDAALAKALAAAWEAAAPGTAAAAGPSWPGPVLSPRWTMDLTARPLAVTAFAPPQGGRIVIGHEDGLVRRLDLAGAADGEFRTDGPVQALLGCDLDGQPGEELLVGSDDERLYARGHDLAEIWTYRVPFLRDEQPWLWWTLGKAKVRRLHAADLDGDGRPEILAGCGNMRLHCIDTAGKELWRFRTDHGICTTLTSADVFGEGRTRLLAGNGLTSSAGSCWVLDERGKTLQRYYNGSWCTALPAIAVGDLDGDGKQTVFCGNNRGDVRAYAAVTTPVQPLWIRNMTRPIRSLTVLPRPGGAVLAVGSDSGTLCAFDESGALAWRLPLSSAITHTALLRRGDGVLLAAGCKDGRVFLVTPSGEMAGQAARPGRLQDLAVVRNAADGTRSDAVVVVSADPNEVWMLAAP